MATQIKSYSIMIYGGPDGYQSNRAQIVLRDAAGKSVAWLRFSDPDMTIDTDFELGGVIRMHLPSTMLATVLDVLRSEQPLYVRFIQDRGLLSTTKEPIGEGEGEA